MEGKACKGEEECGKNGRPDGYGGIRNKTEFSEIDAICGKCPFLATKPGNTPIRLVPLVAVAYRMEALLGENAGGTYPHFYTTLEWECYLTLKHARAKDSQQDLPTAKPKNNAAIQAALGANVKR